MDGTLLIRALIDSDLVGPSEVMDGAVALRNLSSRNRNVLVERRGRPGLLLKWEATPGLEAGVYRRLHEIAPLRRFVPDVVTADLLGALVLSADEGSADLVQHQRTAGGVRPRIARDIGRALGTLHRETSSPPRERQPDRAPGALQIHRPRIEALRELTPGSIEVIRLVQLHPVLADGLERLRRRWRVRSQMHGDVKWVNIVVTPAQGQQSPRIRLVDWEHTGEGDGAWDLGSALAGFLTCWIGSFGDGTASAPAGSARYTMKSMRPAVTALWDGYLASVDVDRRRADGLLRRATKMSAARLVRTAFEEADARGSLSRRAAMHLQVAANIFASTDEAALHLLGISV